MLLEILGYYNVGMHIKYCCVVDVVEDLLLFGRLNAGSVVGIATAYGLDVTGIEFLWGRAFPHLSIPALTPTQPPVQWVPGLSRG
jgi:hypothetical protein